MEKTIKSSRFKISKNILLFWCLFIGIGAVCGSTCMFIDTSGKLLKMQLLLPYFQVLPFANILFQDYLFAGISLLIVNGISNLTASFLILAKKKIGVILGTIFGFTLMLWITIQFVIFPMNFMSTIYFIFGFCQLVTGIVAVISQKQDAFKFNECEYAKISDNSTVLVVYFSRMGYTKKIAYGKANELNAEIYEIKSTERISGNLGFWWCGRFGMHKWGMPIEEIKVDLEKYEKVVIVAPIWVFSLCAPMREFCKQASGKIKAYDCILVHHMSKSFESPIKEINQLLKVNCESLENVCCKFGVYRRRSFKSFND